MAFVNEIVSDADIDKYGLPFPKGAGRYWTRDAERDMYLWGGKGGNPAFGEEILGKFIFGIGPQQAKVVIKPGQGSKSFAESPYRIAWESIVSMRVPESWDANNERLVQLVKEALIAYGQDGQDNRYTPRMQVSFDF